MDGMLLCAGCMAGLARNVESMPLLYGELTRSIAGVSSGSGGAGPISGTRDYGVRVNYVLMDVVRQIEVDLRHHCKWVVRERELVVLQDLDWDVRTMTVIVRRNLSWFAATEDAGHVRATFRELVGKAFGVLEPRRRPMVLGGCTVDGCDGELSAVILDAGSHIVCSSAECGLLIETAQWGGFLKRYAKRNL